jgi:predicted ester cyclase
MAATEELVHGMFSAIEARDFDTVAASLTPDCDFRAPGIELRGPDGFLAWTRPFLEAFPDIHHHIGPIVAAGDGVAFELEIHGTHTEPLVTPEGALPPTQRPLHLSACNIWRLDEGGGIASYHVYFDQVAFMVALGLIPQERD